jgi:RNA polymerase sigma-70 factor (ECF subfamily)
LARLAAGDRDALAPLVAAHRGAVFRFARRMLHHDAEAEDVLQETFLAVLRGAGTYAGRGSVRGWILAIARNQVSMARRRSSEAPAEPEELARLGQEAGWGSADDPERWVRALERKEQLSRALAAIPAPEREVLLLRDLEGLSGDETSALLGIGLAAMKSRLHRARLHLMAALRKEGIDDGGS